MIAYHIHMQTGEVGRGKHATTCSQFSCFSIHSSFWKKQLVDDDELSINQSDLNLLVYVDSASSI